MPSVLVAGGTGYVGRALVTVLVARKHDVRVLTRAASVSRVPAGAATVLGDALEPGSYSAAVRPGDTIVQLVGTPHPSPSKAAEFQRVDAPSINAAVHAARSRGALQLVYVSVAHPAPLMRAYVEVRSAGEAAIRSAGLTATILRPWYVLGPGHRWPIALVPIYAAARLVPSLRAGAERLGLVTLAQMVAALVAAVEHPPAPGAIRIVEVPEIRRAVTV
ncbi:MAG TPA: NAD(P)H-binding protein [Vicinamibacterales bacterium]|nr:NAD(P)H-binding protein [Vicinamibacterales bacterium]